MKGRAESVVEIHPVKWTQLFIPLDASPLNAKQLIGNRINAAWNSIFAPREPPFVFR